MEVLQCAPLTRSVGGVSLKDLVWWGRLPDECLVVDDEPGYNWDALLSYLRQSEVLTLIARGMG